MFSDPLLNSGLAFALVTLGVAGAAWALRSVPNASQRRAVQRLRDLSEDAPPDEERGNWWRNLVSRIGTAGGAGAGKHAETLKSRLVLAGYTQSNAAIVFTGGQILFAALFATAAGIGAAAARSGLTLSLLGIVMGFSIGFLIPTFVLSSAVNRRQRLLRNAIPDALDIMVLGVEGGASLNAAVQWVADELPGVHPILGEEIALIHREMQLGLPAGEAFRAFAERSGVTEAADLAGAIQQSERFGASIAKALRAYADNARLERQVWAEEVAQKASVKILFPMLLCIFPAIFIVLLGPAAFQMSKLFSH